MSYEECKDLINALIHASELCEMLGNDSEHGLGEKLELAEKLCDELAEYAAGLMAWGLQGRVERSKA